MAQVDGIGPWRGGYREANRGRAPRKHDAPALEKADLIPTCPLVPRPTHYISSVKGRGGAWRRVNFAAQRIRLMDRACVTLPPSSSFVGRPWARLSIRGQRPARAGGPATPNSKKKPVPFAGRREKREWVCLTFAPLSLWSLAIVR